MDCADLDAYPHADTLDSQERDGKHMTPPDSYVKHSVQRLLTIGTSLVLPKDHTIQEEDLMLLTFFRSSGLALLISWYR